MGKWVPAFKLDCVRCYCIIRPVLGQPHQFNATESQNDVSMGTQCIQMQRLLYHVNTLQELDPQLAGVLLPSLAPNNHWTNPENRSTTKVIYKKNQWMPRYELLGKAVPPQINGTTASEGALHYNHHVEDPRQQTPQHAT